MPVTVLEVLIPALVNQLGAVFLALLNHNMNTPTATALSETNAQKVADATAAVAKIFANMKAPP